MEGPTVNSISNMDAASDNYNTFPEREIQTQCLAELKCNPSLTEGNQSQAPEKPTPAVPPEEASMPETDSNISNNTILHEAASDNPSNTNTVESCVSNSDILPVASLNTSASIAMPPAPSVSKSGVEKVAPPESVKSSPVIITSVFKASTPRITVTKSPIVSAPSNTPVVATPTASAKPAAVAVASAPRRSCRARRINSRFDLDEVDESFKQLVARIAAPDSHSILQSPELAFHSPAPPPPVTIHSTVPSSAPHSTSGEEPSIPQKPMAKKFSKKSNKLTQSFETQKSAQVYTSNGPKLPKKVKPGALHLKTKLVQEKSSFGSDSDDDVPLAHYAGTSSMSEVNDTPTQFSTKLKELSSQIPHVNCAFPSKYSIKTIHNPELSSTPISIVCIEDPDEAEELAKFSDSKRAKKQAKGSKVVRKTKGGDISVSRMANGIDKASKNFPTKSARKKNFELEKLKEKLNSTVASGKLLKIVNLKVVPNSIASIPQGKQPSEIADKLPLDKSKACRSGLHELHDGGNSRDTRITSPHSEETLTDSHDHMKSALPINQNPVLSELVNNTATNPHSPIKKENFITSFSSEENSGNVKLLKSTETQESMVNNTQGPCKQEILEPHNYKKRRSFDLSTSNSKKIKYESDGDSINCKANEEQFSGDCTASRLNIAPKNEKEFTDDSSFIKHSGRTPSPTLDAPEQKVDLSIVRDTRTQTGIGAGEDDVKYSAISSPKLEKVRDGYKKSSPNQSPSVHRSYSNRTYNQLPSSSDTPDTTDNIDYKRKRIKMSPPDSKDDVKPDLLMTKIIEGSGIEAKPVLSNSDSTNFQPLSVISSKNNDDSYENGSNSFKKEPVDCDAPNFVSSLDPTGPLSSTQSIAEPGGRPKDDRKDDSRERRHGSGHKSSHSSKDKHRRDSSRSRSSSSRSSDKKTEDSRHKSRHDRSRHEDSRRSRDHKSSRRDSDGKRSHDGRDRREKDRERRNHDRKRDHEKNDSSSCKNNVGLSEPIISDEPKLDVNAHKEILTRAEDSTVHQESRSPNHVVSSSKDFVPCSSVDVESKEINRTCLNPSLKYENLSCSDEGRSVKVVEASQDAKCDLSFTSIPRSKDLKLELADASDAIATLPKISNDAVVISRCSNSSGCSQDVNRDLKPEILMSTVSLKPSNSSEAKYSETESKPLPEKSIARASIQTKEEVSSETSSTRDTIDNPVTPPSLPDSKPLMNVMDLLNLCRANIPNSSREPSDSPPGEKADVNTNTFVSDIAVPDSPNNKTSMGALPTDSVPSHLPNVMPVFNSHSTPDFPLKLPLNAMGTNPVGISTTEDFEASKARAQQRLRELGASSDSDVSPDSSMRKRSPPYHENTLNDAAVHVRKLDVDEKLEDVYKLAAREACSLQKDVNFESGKLSNSFDVPGDLVGDVPADKDDSPYIASPEPKVEETPEEREKREEEERRLAVEKEERNKAVVEARLNSYVHLKENLYLIDRKKSKQSKEVRRMVCDCFLTKEELANGEKGCGEDCLNRLLMIECGWRCPLGDACLNRQFQTCAYGPVEVFNAEEKGCGVRATSLIEPGTFIMEYVGEVFDQREFRRRRKDYGKDGTAHFYFMALKADQFIDATRKGNISRFVNHSCDPNAETQKWTVNGDLRIGFFATKFIRPGEEINFDYRMERYGREPQKCYCGTAICRGWLGEPPDEKTKEEKEEEKKKLVSSDKRKKEEKKHFDDELLDDVSELARVGLRNKRDTLLLSRVMVRAETNAVRMQLLSLLCAASANMPCLRLFMDYHGLSLLWSWMADLSTALQHAPLKLKILNALDILPITNRTQVSDSRVMEMVEKWSKQLPPPPPAVAPASAVAVVDGSPTHTVAEKRKNIDDGVEDDDSSQLSSDDNSKQGSDENSKQFLSPEDNSSDSSISTGKNKPTASAGVSVPEESSSNLASEPDDSQLRRIQLEMVELALKLLERWQVLKEEFRIPKKQRVELMKEHEREVEAGYRRYLDTERGKRETKDRYGRSSYDNWRCKVPVLDSHGKAQRWPSNDAISIMMNSEEFAGLSKEERREKFAQKVAQEDEQRRLQEGMWSVHVERCGRIGLDPYHSPIVDPSGQYYWDASNSTWVPLTPETAYAAGIISPAIAQQHGVPVTGSFGIPGVDASMVYDPNSPPVLNGKILPPVVVTVKLPPHWHIARDQFNRVYFYHNRSRQTQWEIPTTETKTTVQISDSESDSTSSSSDSEEEFSSDEDDANDDEAAKAKSAAADADDAEAAVEGKIIRRQRGKKKHSEALVQQRVISPIRELDRELARKERREAKERAKHEARKERQYQELMVPADDEDEDDVYDGASDDVLLSRVAHHASRDKLKTKSKERAATAIADNSERARKIKDLFRSRMATFIVSVLNPYRRADCKKARINTTDDFKYLARKLTHFVMVKELKQLPSIDDLDCSESVKHKTKDFVRKYMAKYGTSFKRDPLDTKEY
ncbi:microtubule-associated protein futsch isoform X2 [Hyalella azteca]|uniref:[histone H3]-lysine(36) N-trimethyltransferase n=1 Tax=Hyalella azteca TaxID=294128 RepID=A0A8B7NZS7_HYAAZ|nr:microtubule-associated protein futsch isoform X2 [Hyalella azteca]